MKRKSWIYYIVILFAGALIGSALGEVFSYILPPGVVQDFFLRSATASFGPAKLDIVILTFTIGFSIKINITAVIGVLIAAYALRWAH